jgi:hypothetical protein
MAVHLLHAKRTTLQHDLFLLLVTEGRHEAYQWFDPLLESL